VLVDSVVKHAAAWSVKENIRVAANQSRPGRDHQPSSVDSGQLFLFVLEING